MDWNQKVDKKGYFTLGEITGKHEMNIPEEPIIWINIFNVIYYILNPIREHFEKAVIVSSFNRSPAYTLKKKLSLVSQHPKGQAVDFKIKGFSRSQMWDAFLWIKHNIDYDKIIFEEKNGAVWIHASYNIDGNRGKAVIAKYNTKLDKMEYKEVL